MASTPRASLFMMLGLGAFMIMSSAKPSGRARWLSRISQNWASSPAVGSVPNSSSQMTSSNMKRSF